MHVCACLCVCAHALLCVPPQAQQGVRCVVMAVCVLRLALLCAVGGRGFGKGQCSLQAPLQHACPAPFSSTHAHTRALAPSSKISAPPPLRRQRGQGAAHQRAARVHLPGAGGHGGGVHGGGGGHGGRGGSRGGGCSQPGRWPGGEACGGQPECVRGCGHPAAHAGGVSSGQRGRTTPQHACRLALACGAD